jgi:antitoxin VapB
MIKAKIFKNGQSQAVRLPKEFRLQGKEVSVTRLGFGVVLQPIIPTWRDVFDVLKSYKSDDILIERLDSVPQDRESIE